MSLSISRANLPGSGAPKITYNGATIWTRGDLMLPLKHSLQEQVSSMYGRVTKTRQGRKIEISIPVYGFWTNLSVLFPSYILGFTRGARMFGTSDTPMTIIAKNGDKIVIKNVQITGLANLKLAANQQIFSADLKLTALIANNAAPTDANAFYTITVAQAYTEGDFPQSNFKSLAWTGAWNARTGFTNILTQDGWDIAWECKTTDDLVDGIGPVDMFMDQFWAAASAIVVGPTLTQLDTAVDFQGTNAAVGADIAADSDNLILTDGTSTLTLTKAALIETGLVFAPGKKRIAKTVWESTLGFTSGAPNAMAAVA
jgi:hypothetical protein